jgi:hypothetical protein
MATAWKRLFRSGSLLVLFVGFSGSASFGSEEIVFGPREFKISPWYFHLSYHTFSMESPGESRLLISKGHGDKKLSGGYVLLNSRIISLHDFLNGSNGVFESRVDLRSRNSLAVFLTGTPGAVLFLEIRTIPPLTPPPEVEFSAEPQVIAAGETSTLQWRSEHAETVWIDQGIGAVEKSGFHDVAPGQTTEYRLTASGDGGSTTKSVLVEVRAGLTVLISSPSEGESINGSHVLVKGAVDFAEGVETGVTVNGVLALVHGGEFVANGVPLQEGVNLITAEAVDESGNRGEASVSVYGQIGGNGVRIKAEPDFGVAPFTSTLSIESFFTFTDPLFSYSGPGVVEFLENNPFRDYDISVGVPGLYTISLEVRDEEGTAHTGSVAVLVMDREVLDALLKEKWNGMKDALSEGDPGKAMSYIAQGAKNMYEYNFNLLGAFMGEIAAGLEDIDMVQVQGRAAEYEMWAEQDGQMYSFYVLFVKDQDGIWRIEFF